MIVWVLMVVFVLLWWLAFSKSPGGRNGVEQLGDIFEDLNEGTKILEEQRKRRGRR